MGIAISSMPQILICATVARITSGSLIHPGHLHHYKRMLFVFWDTHLRYSRCLFRLHRRIRCPRLHRRTRTFPFMSTRTCSKSAFPRFVFAKRMP